MVLVIFKDWVMIHTDYYESTDWSENETHINTGGGERKRDRERKRKIDKVVANWRQFLFDSRPIISSQLNNSKNKSNI